MKKILICLTLAIAGMMATGCSSCQSENDKQEVVYHDYDGVVQDFTAGVSHIQALHRQTMYSIIQHLQAEGHTIALNGKYQWRNSLVILNDTVTLENIDDLHVISIRDVFFYWDNQRGPQVQYITDHVKDGQQIPYPISDVWIEDSDMSDAPIKLSAEDALIKLKEYNATVNGILPRDCNFITLRLPVGPKACNPQWTFGDIDNVLFIDAVTGEVRDHDPAFSQEQSVKAK